SASPNRNTNCAVVVGNAKVTNVPSQKPSVVESGAQPETINPPLAKPMNRMNRPMPTPIDRRSANGTAFMMASRAPMTTSTVIGMPPQTMPPSAPSGVRPKPGSVNATMALMPRPAASANGYLPMMPIAMVMIPAISAVAADTATGSRPSGLAMM